MTEAQLNRRWQKLCEDIAALAKKRGAIEPFIFACEAGLCVLDGPPFDDATGKARGEAELFTLPVPPSAVVAYDAGGW